MLRDKFLATERQLWERVREAAPLCRAIRVVGLGKTIEQQVTAFPKEAGRGLLTDWLTDAQMRTLKFISWADPTPGHIDLALGQHNGPSSGVRLTFLGKSAWSNGLVPLSESKVWPEDVLLAQDEEFDALICHTDYYGIAMQGDGAFYIAAMPAADGRRKTATLAYLKLKEQILKGNRPQIEHPRREWRVHRVAGEYTPKGPFTLLGQVALPDLESPRLFRQHALVDIVNHQDPLPV